MEELFEFEKTKFRKRKLTDEDPDAGMWLAESPQRRLEAQEFLRQSFHGKDYAAKGIQRVYRVYRRKGVQVEKTDGTS